MNLSVAGAPAPIKKLSPLPEAYVATSTLTMHFKHGLSAKHVGDGGVDVINRSTCPIARLVSNMPYFQIEPDLSSPSASTVEIVHFGCLFLAPCSN